MPVGYWCPVLHAHLPYVRHPEYPDERLVACRNPELAKLRAHKRQSLLDATARELEKVRGMVARGRLRGAGAIGVRVGKVVNQYKVGKHFELEIRDGGFDFRLRNEQIEAEAAQERWLIGLVGQRQASCGQLLCYEHVHRSARAPSVVDVGHGRPNQLLKGPVLARIQRIHQHQGQAKECWKAATVHA